MGKEKTQMWVSPSFKRLCYNKKAEDPSKDILDVTEDIAHLMNNKKKKENNGFWKI